MNEISQVEFGEDKMYVDFILSYENRKTISGEFSSQKLNPIDRRYWI